MLKFNTRTILFNRSNLSHEQVFKASQKVFVNSLLAALFCCLFTQNQLVAQCSGNTPSMNCNGSVDVYLDSDGNASISFNDIVLSYNENCSTGTPSFAVSPSSLNCSNIPTVPVTATITNGCGCSQSCTVTVNVIDNLPPAITCPANTTVDCATGNTSIGANGMATAVDNCGGTLTYPGNGVTLSESTSGCSDNIIRTWTATYDGLSSPPCTQIITVQDNIPPVVSDWDSGTPGIQGAPGDITISCSDPIPPLANFLVSDNCGSVDAPSSPLDTDNDDQDADPTACGHYEYTITRTYEFTDDCGNTTTHVQTINVVDNEKPVFTYTGPTPPFQVNAVTNCEGSIPAAPGAGSLYVTASDCAAGFLTTSFTVIKTSGAGAGTTYYSGTGLDASVGSPYPVGNYDVIFQATDPCGNTDLYLVPLEIVDNNSPTAACQGTFVSPLIFSLPSVGNFFLQGFQIDNGSTDNCTPQADLILSAERDVPASGLGPNEFDCNDIILSGPMPIPVTLTVTDVNNNVGTCPSWVRIIDTAPPVALCQDITVELNTTTADVVAMDIDAGSDDACGIVDYEITKDGGVTWKIFPDFVTFSCSEVGTNTVTLRVTDAGNNPASTPHSSTCDATVTVEDNIAPTASCTNQTFDLGQDGMFSLFDPMAVTGTPTGSGSVAFSTPLVDVVPIPKMGDGVVLDVNVELNINHANRGDLKATLESPSGTVVTLFDRPGFPTTGCTTAFGGSYAFDDSAPNASSVLEGNCSANPGSYQSTAALSGFIGENMAGDWTLTLTDSEDNSINGNLMSGSIVVTYASNADLNSLASSSVDNCDFTVSSSQTMFNCSHVSAIPPIMVTVTVTDPSNNSDDCTATVTINDNIDPVFTCADTTVGFDASGIATVDPIGMLSGGMFLESGNSGSGVAGYTEYSIVMPNAFTFKFNWDYKISATETFSTGDPFGYRIGNGAFQQLTNNSLGDQSGMATVNVSAGDVFAFRIATTDNHSGRATVEISDFSLLFAGDFAPSNWMFTNSNPDTDGKGHFFDACGIDEWEIRYWDGSTWSAWMDDLEFDCATNLPPSNPLDVQIRARDNNGNEFFPSTMPYCQVEFVDNLPPIASCDEVNVSLGGGNSVVIHGWMFDQGSYDACSPPPPSGPGDLSFEFSDDGGTTYQANKTYGCSDLAGFPKDVKVKVIDQAGNEGLCPVVQLTITDNQPPALVCPPDVTIDCFDSTLPANTGFATATDNCISPISPTWMDLASSPVVKQIGPGFFSVYHPSNWTFNANGSATANLNASGAPFNVEIKGSADTPSPAVDHTTSFSENVTSGGTVSFDVDCPSCNTNDRFRFRRNGTLLFEVTTGTPTSFSGISVVAGDLISFEIFSDQIGSTATATVSNFSAPASFNNSECQVINREWKATDGTNELTCEQMITVEDNGVPNLVGVPSLTMPPPPPFYECNIPAVPIVTGIDPNNCDPSVTIVVDTVDERIDYSTNPPSWRSGYEPGDCNRYNGYDITRTWTAVDDCGNYSYASRTITIEDNNAPVFTYGNLMNINNSLNQCSGVLDFDIKDYIEDCVPIQYLTVTHRIDFNTNTASPTTGIVQNGTVASAVLPVGEHELHFWADDLCGNGPTMHTITITVIDNETPSAVCQTGPIPLTVTSGGSTPIDPNTVDLASDDNCGIVLWEVTPSFVSCTTTPNPVPVTLKVTDAAGKFAECTTSIQINGASAPAISCPVDVTIDCTESLDPSVNTSLGMPTVNNACGTIVPMMNDVTLGGAPDNCRTIERTWTATNAQGSDACVQTIVVEDNVAPVIDWNPAVAGIQTVPPGDITVECDAVPSALTYTASDPNGCGTAIVNFTGGSTKGADPSVCGTYYNYTITRTWSATDGCNSTSPYTQTITVVDTKAPVIAIPDPFEVSADMDACEALVSINLLDYISDCTPDVLLDVTHNPPTGGGSTIGGTYAVGDHSISVTATDICGKTDTKVFTLRVKDEQNPVAQCFNSTVFLDNTGNGALTVTEVDNMSDDNCGNVTLSFAAPPAATLPTLNFTTADVPNSPIAVTLHVTDDAGNTNTCPANITVIGDLALLVGDQIGSNGDIVDLPVTVKLFEEVTSIGAQFGFSDNAVADFVGISDIHPDIAGGIVSGPFPGNTASFNWFHAPVPPATLGVTLNDDDILFNLQVEITGNTGDMTDIVFNSLTASQVVGGTATMSTPIGFDGTLTVVAPGSTNLISGSLFERPDCGTDLVEQVNVEYDGTTADGTLTNQPGTFSLAVPNGEDIIFTPSKNINYDNDVSSFDAVVALQYISGVPITGGITPTPYQIVAMDANSDNVLLPFDAGLIHQLANGFPVNIANFPNSWRFIPTAETLMPFPFSAPFDESITLTNVTGPVSGVDFYGVKVGDIVPDNGVDCADPANFGPGTATDGNGDDLIFLLQDQSISVGEEVLASFTAQDFTQMISAQYTFNFEPTVLEYVETIGGDLPNLNSYSFNPLHAEDGMVATSWFNMTPVDRADGTVLFTMKFVAKQDAASLSELIYVSSDFVQIQAVTGDAVFVGVDIEFEGLMTDTKEQLGAGFALYQNTPNPFADATVIRFNLPENTAATLTVTDAAGRVLKVIEGDFTAGSHQVSIGREELAAQGILFYRLDTPTNTAVKKMVLLD